MILSSINPFIIVLLVLVTIAHILFFIFIFSSPSIKRKYRNFVLNHSKAYKQLCELNKRYKFKEIPSFDMIEKYDNPDIFKELSCQDYLIYRLVDNYKKVNVAIKDSFDNKTTYELYKKEMDDKCLFGQYDTSVGFLNKGKLLRYERKLFDEEKKNPIIDFSIFVRLELTNINGYFISCKRQSFSVREIKDIIYKINKKEGIFIYAMIFGVLFVELNGLKSPII